MKRQYLGDSKDSFKWDYHDYITSALSYPQLNIALMLTPDDGGSHGSTKADWFPARTSILGFCQELRRTRMVEDITTLPRHTGAQYDVLLHRQGGCMTSRSGYFSGFNSHPKQIVFLDPDNGFEPEKSSGDKHVQYADVARLLQQISSDSIVSVFHHFRRIPFVSDFARIRERLGQSCHASAIYWHSLMFVAVAASKEPIDAVTAANKKYAVGNPVEVIA